jgi:hypothetical protein
VRRREAALGAEGREDLVRVHVQVTRVGADVSRDEPGGVEGIGIAVLDRRDVGRLDPKLALHVQEGLAHGRTFAAHDIAELQLEIVETPRLRLARVDVWLVSTPHRPELPHSLVCDPDNPQDSSRALIELRLPHDKSKVSQL